MKTLDDIAASDRAMLTAEDISPVARIRPHALRIMAREGRLPWPAVCSGTRVLFPREPFLQYMGGKK